MSIIFQIFFFHTLIQKKILINEGVKKPLFVVGSTIVDNLKKMKLKKIKTNFFLLTIHRFENVSIKSRLKKIINIMIKISKIYNLEVLFPCHPNTQNKIKKFNINLNKNIIIINPIDYNFLFYLKIVLLFSQIQVEYRRKLYFKKKFNLSEIILRDQKL